MTNTLPNLETRLAALESENAELKQRVTDLETLPQKLVDDLSEQLGGLRPDLSYVQEFNR